MNIKSKKYCKECHYCHSVCVFVWIRIDKKKSTKIRKTLHRYRVIMLRPNDVFFELCVYANWIASWILFFVSAYAHGLCVCKFFLLLTFYSLFQCINLIFTIDCIFHCDIADFFCCSSFILLYEVQHKIKTKIYFCIPHHPHSAQAYAHTYWWKKNKVRSSASHKNCDLYMYFYPSFSINIKKDRQRKRKIYLQLQKF